VGEGIDIPTKISFLFFSVSAMFWKEEEIKMV
jgi:hypothetical protein